VINAILHALQMAFAMDGRSCGPLILGFTSRVWSRGRLALRDEQAVAGRPAAIDCHRAVARRGFVIVVHAAVALAQTVGAITRGLPSPWPKCAWLRSRRVSGLGC